MVVKLMGIGDLLSAILVVVLHYQIQSDFHLISWRIGIIFVAYLIMKGWLLRGDINSIMDVLCGLYVFVMLFGFTTIVSWVVAIYLFQKAVFSLAA
ncbi:hypothetical protein KY362_03165 [Candidatus Woesearchaeota archaeon]|nr:hypothetical protein [Candidatus Woesearchaeota archaeon]